MLHRGLWVRKARWLVYCKMQPGASGHILGILHLTLYVLGYTISFPVILMVVWALQHTQYLSQSTPLPGMKQNLITPPSSSSQTQPAPLCDHISLFPPLQSYSLQMGVTNMLGEVQQRITCCYYIRAQTSFISQEVRHKTVRQSLSLSER